MPQRRVENNLDGLENNNNNNNEETTYFRCVAVRGITWYQRARAKPRSSRRVRHILSTARIGVQRQHGVQQRRLADQQRHAGHRTATLFNDYGLLVNNDGTLNNNGFQPR